jgi:hypothetical protein
MTGIDQVGALFLGHGNRRKAIGGIGGFKMVGAQAQVQTPVSGRDHRQRSGF